MKTSESCTHRKSGPIQRQLPLPIRLTQNLLSYRKMILQEKIPHDSELENPFLPSSSSATPPLRRLRSLLASSSTSIPRLEDLGSPLPPSPSPTTVRPSERASSLPASSSTTMARFNSSAPGGISGQERSSVSMPHCKDPRSRFAPFCDA